jgi:hypothetical protein
VHQKQQNQHQHPLPSNRHCLQPVIGQ